MVGVPDVGGRLVRRKGSLQCPTAHSTAFDELSESEDAVPTSRLDSACKGNDPVNGISESVTGISPFCVQSLHALDHGSLGAHDSTDASAAPVSNSFNSKGKLTATCKVPRDAFFVAVKLHQRFDDWSSGLHDLFTLAIIAAPRPFLRCNH